MTRSQWLGPVTSIVVLSVCTVMSIGAAQQTNPEHAAIVKLIADRQQAWNAGDDEGYARLLTPDADISSGSGRIARGRDAVIQLYREQRAGVYAGASTSTRVINVRMIRPDIALVDVERELTGLRNSSVATKSRTFFVVVRQPDQRWLITAQRAGQPEQTSR